MQTDQSALSEPNVLVAGEALIDFVHVGEDSMTYRAMPGGSPFNVAVGLACLEVPTGFLGRLSTDPFGQRLRGVLHENGVSQDYVQDDPGPTTLAMVVKRADHEPQFLFYGHDAADQHLVPDDLPAELPGPVRTLHFGSYSMVRQPIGSTLTGLMQRESGKRLISFDPNVRPQFILDLEDYKARLEEWIQLSTIVKLSQADLEFLYPRIQPDDIAKQWLAMGPKLLVVTRGKDGATGFTANCTARVPSPDVQLVDSVGAGDAFTAGLLAWLYHHRHLSLDAIGRLEEAEILGALRFANQVASLTCTRQGADPPHRSQLIP
ncbi:carbohydrate kinase [Candidatus Bipolaricaulota bacterium]